MLCSRADTVGFPLLKTDVSGEVEGFGLHGGALALSRACFSNRNRVKVGRHLVSIWAGGVLKWKGWHLSPLGFGRRRLKMCLDKQLHSVHVNVDKPSNHMDHLWHEIQWNGKEINFWRFFLRKSEHCILQFCFFFPEMFFFSSSLSIYWTVTLSVQLN